MNELKTKLTAYGFPEAAVALLLKGKKAAVLYGTVKLDRKSGVLTTWFLDGTMQTEKL